MVAKGLDFENVTLGGGDLSAVSPSMCDDFRREATFRCLTQVVGRAGRETRRAGGDFNPIRSKMCHSVWARQDCNRF